MSNAKETPRQKMISLMYLVLTAMLALNVSKEVLQGFVTINESLETTNANFSGNTQKIMQALDEAIQNGHHEYSPYYAKATQVTQMTQLTYNYIDSLKRKIVQYTEDVKGADTMKLAQLESLDDYDKPTYFLIGDDETRPKTGAYSAKELRKNMIVFTDSLNNMLDYMNRTNGLKLPANDYNVLKDKIKVFTPQDNYIDKDGLPLNWELRNFYNLPLAAVITNLSKIQSDLRNIEGEAINTFASAPGKMSINFNQFEARIVPESKYVQAGSAFSADVFLSAGSTDFKEDNMQFILGEIDTVTGKPLADAVILPIENGKGKISLPATSVGNKNVKGWIKFRSANGSYKYYRYNNSYVVANAAVAVSPDKMNIFYAGVENPVTVSAAGVAPTDLVVNISGCNGKLQNNGNGKFIASVSGTGSCQVTVFQKTATGLKQQGAPQIFRVKRIPDPPLRIGGKTINGNMEMKASELKNISTIGVDLSNFGFNEPFKIKEFSVTVGGPGMQPQYIKCSGNELSPAIVSAFSKLKAGAKIYIEDIKAQAPDGPRDMPTVKILVK